MNCFRKQRNRDGGDSHSSKQKQKNKRKSKPDEKDGIHFSKTLTISSESENPVLCCGNRNSELKGKAELTHYDQQETVVPFTSPGPIFEAYLPVSKDDPFYNMNHPKRGKAVIFNFDHWDNTAIPDLGLNPRLGSSLDRDDLGKCLHNLDFEVQCHDNCGNLDFWRILQELSQEDHTSHDCLLVAVMTHGERNTVYMRDGTMIPVNLIWENFEANRCPTLAGKPKIFLVQACRGKKYDSGTKLVRSPLRSQDLVQDEVDSHSFSYVIPNAADILVAFSCPLGHYSWRNPEKGSWFIQAICKVFNKHAYEMDLQTLLTTVAREVALNYQSNTMEFESHKKKQVTSTSSTLIRTVRFAPKQGAATYLPSEVSYENHSEIAEVVSDPDTDNTETLSQSRL